MESCLRAAENPRRREPLTALRHLRLSVRRIGHAIDRLLHASRRRSTLRRLRDRGAAKEIVFVCNGNIYRSPFAARLLRQVLGDPAGLAIRVDSAGLFGPGRPSPPMAHEVAREYGVALGEHQSRLVTTDDLAPGSILIVMEPRQRRRIRALTRGVGARVLVLGDLDPEPIRVREIPDPWDGAEEAVTEAYARIARCVGVMAPVLSPEPGRSGADERGGSSPRPS